MQCEKILTTQLSLFFSLSLFHHSSLLLCLFLFSALSVGESCYRHAKSRSSGRGPQETAGDGATGAHHCRGEGAIVNRVDSIIARCEHIVCVYIHIHQAYIHISMQAHHSHTHMHAHTHMHTRTHTHTLMETFFFEFVLGDALWSVCI